MSLPTKTELLNKEDQATLLDVARKVIRHGVVFHAQDEVNAADFVPSLQEYQSSFVTLRKHAQLRGCMGNLHANRPLVVDVAQNAFAAAFEDPRFPALDGSEMDDLELHLSVLTPLDELFVHSLPGLQEEIQPGRDGVYLEEGKRKATLLPSVWASLKDPESFTSELLKKGGWPRHYWSPRMRAYRYRTQEFP